MDIFIGVLAVIIFVCSFIFAACKTSWKEEQDNIINDDEKEDND